MNLWNRLKRRNIWGNWINESIKNIYLGKMMHSPDWDKAAKLLSDSSSNSSSIASTISSSINSSSYLLTSTASSLSQALSTTLSSIANSTSVSFNQTNSNFEIQNTKFSYKRNLPYSTSYSTHLFYKRLMLFKLISGIGKVSMTAWNSHSPWKGLIKGYWVEVRRW